MSERIFSDELARLMDERSVTQSQLASACGVSQGAVSRWLGGSIPKSDKLQQIAEFFSVSTDQLVRGKAWVDLKEDLRAANEYAERITKSHDDERIENALFRLRAENEERKRLQTKVADELRVRAKELCRMADELAPLTSETKRAECSRLIEVPLFGRIAAGFPVDSAHPSWETITIDADRFPRAAYALRVSGDSLVGADIHDGDIIIMAVREPHTGDIVAARVDEESTLKRFISGKKPCLRAENPKYSDIIPARELVIQGVMIGKLAP